MRWLERARSELRSPRGVTLAYAVIWVTMSASSCTSLAIGRGASCTPVPADSMQTSGGTVASLVGRYRVEVRSTVGAVHGVPDRAEWDMVLQRPDSATLALASPSSRAYSARAGFQLVGARRRVGSHTTDPVAWIEGLLRIGCDCDREARDLLLVERIDRGGFRGSWIALLPVPERDRSPWVSGPGTEGPTIPSGYFCAVRVRE